MQVKVEMVLGFEKKQESAKQFLGEWEGGQGKGSMIARQREEFTWQSRV